MNVVELSYDEEQKCRVLTQQRQGWCRDHDARNYKVDGASDDHIAELGLTGEYVVLKALGIGGFDLINLYGPNKAGDILLPYGEWIEVKTTKRPWYNFLVESEDMSFDATYGALVWKMPGSRQYALAGWCTKGEFDTGKRWGSHLPKPAWLMPWRELHSCENWPLFSGQ